jgi:plasmid rolling circle replication initiator protein Rep
LAAAQDEKARRKARRILACGAVLVFVECPYGHERRLKYAEFCRWLLCPMCQWRKSLVIFHQLLAVCHTLHQRQPGTRYLLLTLTIVNVPAEELSAALDRMFRAWQRLTQRDQVRHIVLGWFRTLEVTYNRQNRTYHPHFHALLAVPPSYFGRNYIKHDRWLALWRESMRDPSIQFVNIKTVRPHDRIEGAHPLAGAVAEVGKYATKPGNYIRATQGGYEADPDVVAVLAKVLHHRRLTAYGGVFNDIRKELQLADVEQADLVRIEGAELPCQCSVCQSVMWEHIYCWQVGLGDYVG